jgi:hypothetical protein
MARTVSSFTFAGRQANKIDFSAWADGQIWQLVEGEDFSIEAKKVAGKARTWAKNNGKSVQVSVVKIDGDKNAVMVKFSPLVPATPAEAAALAAPPADAAPAAVNGEPEKKAKARSAKKSGR